MNGCFLVLNTPLESKARDRCATDIRNYMLKHLDELQSPTIRISDSEGVKNFLIANPEFKLDYAGWDPFFLGKYDKSKAKAQGWLYGAIGVWASNFYGWKNFLKTEYDYLLIFENDILLDTNFFEIFNEYVHELPEDWDVFHQYVPDTTYKQKTRNSPISKNISISYQTWSNAVYAISKKGAKKMLVDVQKGIYLPLDWQWFKQRDQYKTYTVAPKSPMGCKLANILSSYQHKDAFQNLSFLEKEL